MPRCDRIKPGLNRRELLASAAGLALASAARAQPPAPARPKACVCLFSKYLQGRRVSQLGEALAGLGYAGVDLTVRPGGHVLPERAADDLPKAHEALKESGVEITMISTDITSADQKHAEATIRTAASLGIRYAKLGYYDYRDLKAVPQAFAETKAKLRELVPMLAKHGVHGGFHNHSGTRAGSMLWDEWELIRDLDPKWIGSYFDPCHATIEGGLGGWRIGLNLLASRITMLAVKDFHWRKAERGWRPEICSPTEGAVAWPEVFRVLKTQGFAGPISMHIEYGPKGEPDSDEEKAFFANVRRDLAFLREQLQNTGVEAA